MTALVWLAVLPVAWVIGKALTTLDDSRGEGVPHGLVQIGITMQVLSALIGSVILITMLIDSVL